MVSRLVARHFSVLLRSFNSSTRRLPERPSGNWEQCPSATSKRAHRQHTPWAVQPVMTRADLTVDDPNLPRMEQAPHVRVSTYQIETIW